MLTDRFFEFARTAWGVRLLTAAFAVGVLTLGLGRGRVLTYHEVCFAQPAREMLAGADWLVPSIAGEIFPDKPPLMHWLVACSMATFGENAFAARLPAALSGVLLAVVAAELGRRLFGPAVGLAAGGVQATAFYTIMQSRLAECDMPMTLFVAIALGTFAAVEWGWIGSTLAARLVVAAAAVAAFLCKGPIALAFIGGGIVVYLAWRRRWRRWLHWLHPVPIVVGLVGVLAWPVAAAWRYPEIVEGWRRHNLDRFSGSLGETVHPLYYFGMIPLLLLPWTPWALVGIRRFVQTSHLPLRREVVALTAAWMLPGLLVLSMAAWKHKHYAIPLLPPLSIVAGLGVVAWARSSAWKWPAAFAALPPRWAAASAFGAAALAATWATQVLVPGKDSYRDQTAFAARVSNTVGAEPIFVPLIPTGPNVPAAFPENQIVFYLPLRVQVAKHVRPTARDFWMLAPRRYGAALAESGEVQTVDRCDSIRGLMNDDDRLTLFRVRPSPQTAGPAEQKAK
jgi:4-amino-4-deoxy-L-arabinose transferase-like glycosyltransferase